MAETPTFKHTVDIINDEALTLSAIAGEPRTYKPQDLCIAVSNQVITCPDTASTVLTQLFVKYLITEFFVLAHRTGLYNRQRELWDALAKIASIDVFQHKVGWFKKSSVPIYDLIFYDQKKRALLFALLVENGHSLNDKQLVGVFGSFLKRAQRLTGISGLCICMPEPFPEAIYQKICKLTNASDPVGRYESLLPEPFSVAIDLFSIENVSHITEKAQGDNQVIHLVHPDLSVTNRGASKGSSWRSSV